MQNQGQQIISDNQFLPGSKDFNNESSLSQNQLDYSSNQNAYSQKFDPKSISKLEQSRVSLDNSSSKQEQISTRWSANDTHDLNGYNLDMIRELSKKNSSVTTEDQEESKEENDPNHLSQRGINEAISYDIEDSNIFNKNQTNQGYFSYQNSSQAQELEESKESSQSVQYTSQEIFRIQENNSNNNSQQSTNYGSSQGIYCYPNDSISGYVFSQENQIIKNESQENNPNNHAFYPANNLNFEQDPIQYEILNHQDQDEPEINSYLNNQSILVEKGAKKTESSLPSSSQDSKN